MIAYLAIYSIISIKNNHLLSDRITCLKISLAIQHKNIDKEKKLIAM